MKPRTRLIIGIGSAFGVLLFAATAAPALRWAATMARNPFAAFTTTASGPVVLQRIQQLNRLETCRYNGEVVVRGENKGLLPTWLSGDRVLLVGRGEVVAGVDLSRLGRDDVTVDGKRLTVRLPRPMILHTRLDNGASQVHDRQSGLFSGPDPALEGKVRLEAEERIKTAALHSGILATAETNARAALTGQLQLLGFQEIRFL
ncbi:MAG: DUF4230 domain-containing protein [Actinomycetota bacterium]